MEYSVSLDSYRSADDSFCIYERYMRSFQRSELPEYELDQLPAAATDRAVPADEDADAARPPSPRDERSLTAEPESLLDNDSSNKPAVSSDDTTRSDTSCRLPKPAIITLVSMENSNNATDGMRVFEPDPVFKLPNNELTFNGTLKHLQKLKPILDPMAALNNHHFADSDVQTETDVVITPKNTPLSDFYASSEFPAHESETQSCAMEFLDCANGAASKERSWSSIAGFKGRESGDSGTSGGGVPSPDMFSDDEEWSAPHSRLQEFLNQHEAYDKLLLKKMEKTLSGVLPPPSITTLKTDVNEMLTKYYCHLPLFTNTTDNNTNTPSKGASYIHTPIEVSQPEQETAHEMQPQLKTEIKTVAFTSTDDNELNFLGSATDELREPVVSAPPMCTEKEAKGTPWPEILKCRFHDVHYNICGYSERVERAASRVAQRYVGEEMASTVTVFSSGRQSPTSAQKRKALRVKMAQNKSPGRRLSHLARRRQMFSAASLAEKAQNGSSKMVLIDKNFFPHRKLTYTSERKSPRVKRTPGRKTPGKKTPGKKTPGKSSSRKKTARRLILDDVPTRTQPTRESSKRALFQSPENQTKVAEDPKTNPRLIKSRRNLFGSPLSDGNRSMDGTSSDGSLKRKRDSFDDISGNCKLHKSLSFGGEVVANPAPHTSLARRATEVFSGRKASELTALQKQKLLWAVSNALRAHGWRMGAPGFKDKASALAQLTRRLLTLSQHAARLAASPSTSDYMLRLARKYVFSVIQGCSIEECYREEQLALANESTAKLTGYISAAAYQQMKTKDLPHTAVSSRIKENTCDSISFKTDQPKSANKNVLQDKLVNIDSNSSSNSSFSVSENGAVFKSNSMPSFKEAAKMRARRQISFDNVDVPPKR